MTANRRMNALKHQPTHPTANPAIFKDAFGGAKIGKCGSFFWCVRQQPKLLYGLCAGHVNGVNVIGLTLQGPSVPLAVLRSPSVSQTALPGLGDVMLPLQPRLLLPHGEQKRRPRQSFNHKTWRHDDIHFPPFRRQIVLLLPQIQRW